jgi:hypothetical protein
MANSTATFNGQTARPSFDAAFAAAGTWSSYIQDGGPGQAGAQNWSPTG